MDFEAGSCIEGEEKGMETVDLYWLDESNANIIFDRTELLKIGISKQLMRTEPLYFLRITSIADNESI